jgi:hypothetical protein
MGRSWARARAAWPFAGRMASSRRWGRLAGVVVGWSHDAAEKMKSFRWGTITGTMENLDATTFLDGKAESINNHNAIVGWRTNGTSIGSVIWHSGVPNGQNLFPASDHKAFGINDLGDVVGVKLLNDQSPDEGYYWDSSRPFGDITAEIGTNFYPTGGINNNGVAAGQEDTASGYFALGNLDSDLILGLSPDDDYSIANGLNNRDVFVGESDQKGYFYDLRADRLLPQCANAAQALHLPFSAYPIMLERYARAQLERIGADRYDRRGR